MSKEKTGQDENKKHFNITKKWEVQSEENPELIEGTLEGAKAAIHVRAGQGQSQACLSL